MTASTPFVLRDNNHIHQLIIFRICSIGNSRFQTLDLLTVADICVRQYILFAEFSSENNAILFHY